jgi:AmmeMemoRadiSam system protein A
MSKLFEKASENLIPHEAVGPSSPLSQGFSVEQKRILLRVAHEAILSALEGRAFPQAGPFSAELSAPRGVFTTLYLHGKLRGCVGYVLPVAPLYGAVADTARAAAFEDARFKPVTKDEAIDLKVSLSVLSRLVSIRPEAVEVGRHGLLIAGSGRRGLLLPQVPVEHGWGRETFLDQTCRKAGLPEGAWSKDATIEAFTAEVFDDCEIEVQAFR